MAKKSSLKIAFFVLALIISIVSLVLTFTGLPMNYDTEPILALGLLCLSIAGLLK